MMSQAIEETKATAVEYKVSLRYAAYINAIKRLHAHYDFVGIPFSKWEAFISSLFIVVI